MAQGRGGREALYHIPFCIFNLVSQDFVLFVLFVVKTIKLILSLSYSERSSSFLRWVAPVIPLLDITPLDGVPFLWAWARPSDSLLMKRMQQSDGMSLPRLGY